jgi:hypothetical protein
MRQCRRDPGTMGSNQPFGSLAFAPEDVARMSSAYDLAPRELGLIDRSDALTETVAKTIIEVMATGERDSARICALAIQKLQAAAAIGDRDRAGIPSPIHPR